MLRLHRLPGDVYVIHDGKDLVARIKFGSIKGEETPESIANTIFKAVEDKLCPPQADTLTEA